MDRYNTQATRLFLISLISMHVHRFTVKIGWCQCEPKQHFTYLTYVMSKYHHCFVKTPWIQ